MTSNNRDVAVYKSLIGVLVRNSFKLGKTKRKDGKRSTKASATVGMLVGATAFGIYSAFMAAAITVSAVPMGLQQEVLYVLVAMAQIIVLFFGGVAVMGYLYFSNDNNLLSTLPIKPQVIFAAKFSMAYLSELLFSVAISIPMLIAYGITCIVMGAGVAWHYFVIMLLSVPLLPIIPLFVITIISMPLMYVVSFFRKRAVSNSIALGIVYIAAMGLYFAFIFGMQSLTVATNDTTALSSVGVVLFKRVKAATIFNYNLVAALSGKSTVLNYFIYLIGHIALLAIAVGLSSLFYKRAIAIIAEGAGSSKKKGTKRAAKQEQAVKSSLYRSFFLKEVRTLINTPALLVSTLMSLFLPPILLVFLSGTMGESFTGESGFDGGMFFTGYAVFITFMLISSTNMVATIGISREGKNLYILKTLPISVRAIIKCKLYFAGGITLVATIVMAIIYAIVMPTISITAIIMFPILIFTGCLGVNAIALHSDLKKPNLNWSNISELTKNNKNTLKYMLIVLAIGFVYMIAGIVLAAQSKIKGELVYILFFALSEIPAAILLVVGMTKLFKNPEELFERIGN